MTYAMAGNKRLGGEDFSHRLYRYLLAVYEQRHGCSVRSPHTMQVRRHLLFDPRPFTVCFVFLSTNFFWWHKCRGCEQRPRRPSLI